MEKMLLKIDEAIKAEQIEVSDWERNFLEDIKEMVKRGYNIQRKQRQIVDQIHVRIPFWFDG